VSFEELQSAGEEKDVTILELQQAAETARADLETEKKLVEGMSPLSIHHLSLEFTEIHSRLICLLLSGMRTSLGTSTTQAEALQVAYNSSQRELEVLQEAALEACQSVDEGTGQAGSSVASRL
jgi:hypothetical protein